MKSPGSHELAELLSRTALGDQVAYETLYRATAAKLFGLALRILRRRELAEDCLQDAFVSIWYRAGDYRLDRAQPFTWMAAIVPDCVKTSIPNVNADVPVYVVTDVTSYVGTLR
jgi:DNA-directed RNA polymerase specialized sigma24 family protein